MRYTNIFCKTIRIYVICVQNIKPYKTSKFEEYDHFVKLINSQSLSYLIIRYKRSIDQRKDCNNENFMFNKNKIMFNISQ